MRFGHLAQRLFNVPLAIRPDKAEVIMAALSERLGITKLYRDGEAVPLELGAFYLDADDDDDFRPGGRDRDNGYDVVQGVARIPIEGTLVQKLGTLRPSSGMTGYDGIRQSFLTALGDPGVRAIVLAIDSPGGEVAAMFDLADLIKTGSTVKPTWAILDEMACSAAYLIASAASNITVPRTGMTGSIGIIAMHVDFSQALAKEGLKVTLLTHGDQNADGHPEIPLSDEARARAQGDIDRVGDMFDAAVAKNRGLDANAVRAMQAGTFLGDAGVQAGLADAVMAPDAAFRALLAKLDA